jgi:hypothetical protein
MKRLLQVTERVLEDNELDITLEEYPQGSSGIILHVHRTLPGTFDGLRQLFSGKHLFPAASLDSAPIGAVMVLTLEPLDASSQPAAPAIEKVVVERLAVTRGTASTPRE